MSEDLITQNKTITASVYLWNLYPQEKRYHFTKSRFSKLLYLIDWFNVKNIHSQLTEIKWYFNHFGPYEDLESLLCKPGLFKIKKRHTEKGTIRYYVSEDNKVSITLPEEKNDLDQDNKKSIEYAINRTKGMEWNTFVAYIYRTPPVRQSMQYTYIDLLGIAKKNLDMLS